ncbi:hypothetical protein LTR84_007759 [Exophiala bonariae]|uniref:Uncharacterized protein n=1 Tax=Exophiala bonariae TaxID=1690606 RepID=A0AAV9NNG6_9EURO|nr:hypothetical protein LTR84_007759 [Exophiala bonariae]
MPPTDRTSTCQSQTHHINIAQQSPTSPPPSPASLPPSTPPTKQSPPSWWSRLGVDHWEWELSAAVLCVGALAAIVAVLINYDQKPVPELPVGLTMNAIIAFLSTIAKGALTLILAAILRQEKWLWFIDRPRPLSTIDSFEEASRGPYGSLMLLFKLHGSLRPFLAATILVLALGFEPFLQQLVAFSTRDVLIDGAIASIQTPTTYNESVVGDLGGASLSLNAQIGAFGGANGTNIAPECTGGNCTWPEYNTLALCTICKDVTSEVMVDNARWDMSSLFLEFEQANQSSSYQEWHQTYSFPRGNNLTVDFGLRMDKSSDSQSTNTQWGLNYPRRRVWPLNIGPELDSSWIDTWDNDTYADHPAPFFAMGYLDLNVTEDNSALRIQRATECIFNPCVRTVSTQVINGIVESKVINTDYGAVFFAEQNPDGISLAGGWRATVNGTDFEIVDTGGVAFGMGYANVQGHAYLLIQALRIALEGNTTYSLLGTHYPSGESESTSYEGTGYSQNRGPWSSAGQQAIDGADNFAQVVEGVGHALTGRFQQLATISVSGSATRNYVVMEVRWIWLIYPLALLVLSIASLTATILATHVRHMAVWKESTIPLLYRYAGDGLNFLAGSTQALGHPSKSLSNKVSQIVDEANKELVRLRRHQAIWTLDSETPPERAEQKENAVVNNDFRKRRSNPPSQPASSSIPMASLPPRRQPQPQQHDPQTQPAVNTAT